MIEEAAAYILNLAMIVGCITLPGSHDEILEENCLTSC